MSASNYSCVDSRLEYLIEQALGSDEPEVWKCQIAHGSDWGFDNQSYAFKTDERLLLVIFGWAD